MKRITGVTIGGIMLAGTLLLSGCTGNGEATVPTELEKKIFLANNEGYLLNEEGKYEEALEHLEKAINLVYEQDPSLKNLDSEVQGSQLLDSPFNNAAWAWNELGDHARGLELIEKSLLILPNDDVEYSNKGNALYGLFRYDEALESYDKALELNEENTSAYYGKGLIHYDRGDYEDALKQFDTYLKYEPSDADAEEYRIYALLALDKEETAEKHADSYFKKYSDRYDGYRVKGALLENTAEYDDIVSFYKEAGGKFPQQWEAREKLGEIYYSYNKYDEALALFDRLALTFPELPEVDVWRIKVYGAQGDLKNAEQIYQDGADTADIHMAMGDAYVTNGWYTKSVPYFEKAIKAAPLDQNGYVKKLQALDWGKRYYKCAAFGETALQSVTPASSDIPWYTGQCQYDLGNDEEAITYFQQAVDIDPEDYEAWSFLASSHLALGNEEQAEKFSKKALEIYSEDSTALYVKDALEDRKNPLGERIGQFFKDNYLYNKDADKMGTTLAKLENPSLSQPEMAAVIDKAKSSEDRFTFMVYGELYDQLAESGDEDIIYKDMGDIRYFKIEGFSKNTDDQFIQFLDEIPEPEGKTLILDLRGNGGGLTDSANNMLDALLPDLVTCTLIYNDGYTYNYYSDPEFIDFKKIHIFVDENTASAAELLTLGLKTYSDNVTVIGRPTFGKGVGQRVFEDKENKVMVFAVNHYWNVMQNNVANTRITPDIKVKGSSLESFMKQVK
ncbi:tetratricopeptide repeat protein [Fontibacillus sp. BL9]|uniref:tetratricopeptide repeat protein n=1 Tax=Fontibacillus sp. BL9 TaxID=3389971 RepID=UPI00397A5008